MDSLQNFIADCGVDFNPTFDSQLHRFTIRGRTDKSGWYSGHHVASTEGNGDIYILIWGDWATGESHKRCSLKKFTSNQEKIRVESIIRDMEAAHDRERAILFERAVIVANSLIRAGSINDGSEFPYLVRKQIPLCKGAVISSYKDEEFLGIPLYNCDGSIVGMQKIFADGSKKFISGSKIAGNFFPIGKIDKRIFICEGYATAATIHMATGEAVAVAFNAGNLEAVGLAIKEKFGCEIIFCGDDDQWTVKKVDGLEKPWNPGRELAFHASRKCGARLLFPVFSSLETRPTDFNDLHCLEGLDAVRTQVNAMKPDLKTRFPTLKTNFYHKFVDEKGCERKTPDYLGLAQYFSDELKLLSSDGVMYIYDDGQYSQVSPLGLKHRILRVSNFEVRAEHLDRFANHVRAVAFKSQGMRPPSGLVNLANGVLAIKEGKLLPHSSDYFFKYKLDHVYNPNAQCPKWLEFLDFVFEGNQELINLSAQIFGYAVLGGEPFLHKAFLLYGDGRNGKSTWLDVLTSLLGKANVSSVSMSMLDKPFSVVSLDGKLANIKGESPNDVINSEAFKSAVGGEFLTAAHKGLPEYDLKIDARLFFAANDLPKFHDTTMGAFSKLCIIPFDRFIKPSERLPAYSHELIKEMSGILNWALGGLKELLKTGALPEVFAIEGVMEEYRIESDSVFAWSKERTVLDPSGQWVLARSFYSSYVAYCEFNCFKAVNPITFAKRFRRIIVGDLGRDCAQKGRNGLKVRGIKIDPSQQSPLHF